MLSIREKEAWNSLTGPKPLNGNVVYYFRLIPLNIENGC